MVPEQELLPKQGVYATESVVGGSVHRSVTNIGTRPTFNGKGVTVESHLFGFNDEWLPGGPHGRFASTLGCEKTKEISPVPRNFARRSHATLTAAQQYFSGAASRKTVSPNATLAARCEGNCSASVWRVTVPHTKESEPAQRLPYEFEPVASDNDDRGNNGANDSRGEIIANADQKLRLRCSEIMRAIV